MGRWPLGVRAAELEACKTTGGASLLRLGQQPWKDRALTRARPALQSLDAAPTPTKHL